MKALVLRINLNGNTAAMTDSFKQYVSCFTAGGNEEGGILYACGTNAPGDVKEMQVLEDAYKMGKEV